MAIQLTKLAAKPQLVKITLDSEEVIATYGEELEFYIYDRQPIQKFIQIATSMTSDYSNAVLMMNELILDDKGKPVCGEGEMLPGSIMSSAIQKVIEQLGK
jgi:hypothetical protein